MMAELKLTMEDGVIDSAEEYARKSGRSLSDIVENYLKLITRQDKKNIPELSPQVRRLMGVINLPEDFDYKKEIRESIEKRYL